MTLQARDHGTFYGCDKFHTDGESARKKQFYGNIDDHFHYNQREGWQLSSLENPEASHPVNQPALRVPDARVPTHSVTR